MSLVGKIKHICLQAFVSIIPKSSYQNVINYLLQKCTWYVNPKEWMLMDYSKHSIYVHNGVRQRYASKEPDTVEWLETYLKPDQILFDIGANIGGHSLIAAKFHQSKVRVYAFEPSYDNFYHLASNIIKNNCQDVIFPMNVPLSSESGINVFNYRSFKPGGSGHALGKPQTTRGEEFDAVFKQYLISCTIDQLVYEWKLPFPNHIKMDVDGMEFEIIKGAQKTLADDRLRSVLIEFSDLNPNLNEMLNIVQSKGLKFISKTTIDKNVFNFLFSR